MMFETPVLVGIGGTSSNVGKTTLMCDLLSVLPGWEAIKTTRGHYRSCGKTPHACCVSHLLRDEPTVHSGKQHTYESGKDTGRYWDAGAGNVHWVIATEDQIGRGINLAVQRVSGEGVLIEGNSFSQHVNVDLMVMVTDGFSPIKKSAKAVLAKCKVVYVSSAVDTVQEALTTADLPILRREDLPQLLQQIRSVAAARRCVIGKVSHS